MSAWLVRPGTVADVRGLGYLWLESAKRSDDARRYGPGWWSKRSPLIDHLLREERVVVACDRVDPETVWAFACTAAARHDGVVSVVHYACIKREFWPEREELQRAVLERVVRDATLTHEVDREETGIMTPETWKLDRYWGWK